MTYITSRNRAKVTQEKERNMALKKYGDWYKKETEKGKRKAWKRKRNRKRKRWVAKAREQRAEL